MKRLPYAFLAALIVILGTWGSAYAVSILIPLQGGTGTGAVPSYGQVLIGDGAGNYTPVATSTLNIVGGSSSPGGTSGQLQYNGNGTFTGVATTTLVAGTNVSFSGGTPVIVGTSPVTINATGGGSSFAYPFIGNATTTSLTFGGNQVFTNTPTFSFLGAGTVNSTAAGTIYNTATSTPTVTAPITYSGTLGSFIGGISGTFDCIAATGSVKGCLTAADWTTFNNKQPAGNYITALTGDVTAAGPGSSTATLATVNSNVGSFTNANITVNGKGLITAASNGAGGSGGAIGTSTPLISGQVDFSTGVNTIGNNANFFWDNVNTRLGIGTSTPNHQLTVLGSGSNTSLTNTADSEINISNYNATNNNSAQLAFDTIDASNVLVTGAKIAGQFTSHTAGAVSADLVFLPRLAGTLTERARLTSAGFFGIGSTTPGSLLSVGGNGTGTNFYDNATTTKSGVGGINIASGCFALNGVCLTTGGSGTNFFTQTGNNLQNNTGNALGINTAPNLAALEVQGTTSDATSRALQLWNSSATSLLTVRDDGNVGIGSSTPFRPLSVNGNVWASGNLFHFGDTQSNNANSACGTTANCFEFVGNDNTTGGVVMTVQNISTGASAYGGYSLLNRLVGTATTNYAGTYLNSDQYNDNSFGTANNVPNILQLANSMGPVSVQSFASTTAASYVNIIVASTTPGAGPSAASEVARFIPGSFLVGTTTTILSPTLTPTLVNIAGSPGSTGKLVRINGTTAGIMFAVGSDSTTTDAFSIQTSGNPTGNGINIFTNLPGSGVAIQTNSANANEALSITPKGTGSVTIGNTTSGSSIWNVGLGATVSIRTSGSTIASLGGTSAFTTSSGSGATGRFLITGTTQSGITANAPYQNIVVNDGFVITHAAATTGIITAAQNEMSITPHTDTFPAGTSVANSTIASSSVLFIAGPAAPGALANITNAYGIFIGPGTGTFTTASTSFAAAFSAVAPTGATTNAVSTTTGRVWMNGLTTSAATQSVLLCGSTPTGGELIAESIACTASAGRYKTDIKPLTVGLDEVMKLQPISFKWKADYNKGFENDPNKTGTQYSLKADDVQNVDPNMTIVTTATTTFEGITYAPGTIQGLQENNHWVALLISAIQDQQKEIETLKRSGAVVAQSAQDNWQDGLIGLLILYVLYNEFDKRKKKI